MTVEEVHEHNRHRSVHNISYEAVCTTDYICSHRAWIIKWLELAYEAGYKAAKEGTI